MADIFVSYARDDRFIASQMAENLERHAYSVWWDYHIVGGESFRAAIEEQLASALGVVVIWSASSVRSHFVLEEASAALAGGKLIPVRVSELKIEQLPLGFRTLQTLINTDFTGVLSALTNMGVYPSEVRGNKAVSHYITETARLYELGKYKEGAELTARALEMFPKQAELWCHRGICLSDLCRYREALDCFEAGLEIKPRWGHLWGNKGRTLKVMGRHAEALACYDYAIQYAPSEPTPHHNKANCLLELGRYREALACLEQALALEPGREGVEDTIRQVRARLD
jgi:hypothetical protein